jgi:hypothetical protein
MAMHIASARDLGRKITYKSISSALSHLIRFLSWLVFCAVWVLYVVVWVLDQSILITFSYTVTFTTASFVGPMLVHRFGETKHSKRASCRAYSCRDRECGLSPVVPSHRHIFILLCRSNKSARNMEKSLLAPSWSINSMGILFFFRH